MADRKYSVIVFDLGNVLLPFNYDLVIERFNKVSPGLGDKFVKNYQANYNIHRSFERGDMSEEEFLDKMMGILENKVDRIKFCNDFSKIFILNEKLAALLPELKKRFMLILLSNTNSIHENYGWKDYEFLKYFDKQVLSHKVNALKPEQKIYKAVEAFTKKPPAEHIFIDDVAEYAEGAKKAGWDAVQYTGYEKLISDLKEREIL